MLNHLDQIKHGTIIVKPTDIELEESAPIEFKLEVPPAIEGLGAIHKEFEELTKHLFENYEPKLVHTILNILTSSLDRPQPKINRLIDEISRDKAKVAECIQKIVNAIWENKKNANSIVEDYTKTYCEYLKNNLTEKCQKVLNMPM
jgi:hypothetical protein